VPSAMTTLSGLQTCRKVRRFANDDAALLRLFRSDQVAAERPSHHTFELPRSEHSKLKQFGWINRTQS
jgi:hypothetical protein